MTVLLIRDVVRKWTILVWNSNLLLTSITNYLKAMVESTGNCCRTMDFKELVLV